jgi:hypothetical protein
MPGLSASQTNDPICPLLAQSGHAVTNVGFGGKAEITVDGPECPLMNESGLAH